MTIHDIEIGEYIKTDDGNFYKVDEEFKEKANVNIIDHNPELIKLINVGDFVNDAMVFEICEDGRLHVTTGFLYEEQDIKTAVSKEYYEKGKIQTSQLLNSSDQ